jgi:hypothetical protein
VDGWDAAVKVSALATVLMDRSAPLKPNDIEREGIRGLTMEAVQSAKVMGRRYKLVCQAERRADGTVAGSVRPEQVPLRRRPAGRVRWGDVNYLVSDGRDPRADAERDPPGRGDHGLWAAGGFLDDCEG